MVPLNAGQEFIGKSTGHGYPLFVMIAGRYKYLNVLQKGILAISPTQTTKRYSPGLLLIQQLLVKIPKSFAGSITPIQGVFFLALRPECW